MNKSLIILIVFLIFAVFILQRNSPNVPSEENFNSAPKCNSYISSDSQREKINLNRKSDDYQTEYNDIESGYFDNSDQGAVNYTDPLPFVSTPFPEKSKQIIRRKFKTRNTAPPGEYKQIDYTNGVRGGDEEEALDFIDESNNLMQPNDSDNDSFVGNSDLDDNYAKFNPSKKKVDKFKTSEIFNSKNYLPNDKSINEDWFEVIPEAISVKNRHLINVSKSIGINTIGTSLRNPSWDVRGTPQCPKFVVSPWLQSTIEPDTNLKSLC